jgi:hypothetical protein
LPVPEALQRRIDSNVTATRGDTRPGPRRRGAAVVSRGPERGDAFRNRMTPSDTS